MKKVLFLTLLAVCSGIVLSYCLAKYQNASSKDAILPLKVNLEYSKKHQKAIFKYKDSRLIKYKDAISEDKSVLQYDDNGYLRKELTYDRNRKLKMVTICNYDSVGKLASRIITRVYDSELFGKKYML